MRKLKNYQNYNVFRNVIMSYEMRMENTSKAKAVRFKRESDDKLNPIWLFSSQLLSIFSFAKGKGNSFPFISNIRFQKYRWLIFQGEKIQLERNYMSNTLELRKIIKGETHSLRENGVASNGSQFKLGSWKEGWGKFKYFFFI